MSWAGVGLDIHDLSLFRCQLVYYRNKFVKHPFRICRTGRGLRVELCREPRLRLVADAFIGTVIHIDKQGFPVSWKSCGINGITMILARDKTLCGTNAPHRLIMTAMAILQFICLSPGRPCQELIAETDAHERPHIGMVQEYADVLHRLTALLRVARTIRQKQAIEIKLIEVVVPRNPDNLYTPPHQTADDVGLDSAIDKHNALARSLVIMNHLLATHLLHPIDAAIIGVFRVFRVIRVIGVI